MNVPLAWPLAIPLWYPVDWSRKRGQQPIPLDIWFRWHATHLLPKSVA